MAKKPLNHGTAITPAVVKQVRQLAAQNTPTRVIGIKAGRTEACKVETRLPPVASATSPHLE